MILIGMTLAAIVGGLIGWQLNTLVREMKDGDFE